jgi:hypothetical protein
MTPECFAQLRADTEEQASRFDYVVGICLDEIERLQSEVERLEAAFAPTIELLEDWVKYMKPYTGFINSVNRTAAELARLKAIVKGTE